VLRFLKIITPVKCVIPGYNGHIGQPVEGEFHRRFRAITRKFFKNDQPVWSVDIDKEGILKRGFRLLWDATDITVDSVSSSMCCLGTNKPF
jgi:hypothetical protein